MRWYKEQCYMPKIRRIANEIKYENWTWIDEEDVPDEIKEQSRYAYQASLDIITLLSSRPDKPPLKTLEDHASRMDHLACINEGPTGGYYSVAYDVTMQMIDVLIN